jgi:hypothetical protein
MSRKGWIALISGLVIACLCLSVCSGAFLVGMVIARNTVGISQPIEDGFTPEPRKSPVPTSTPRPVQRTPLPTQPVSGTAVLSGTLEQALSAVLPKEDLNDLAVRFKGVSPAQTVITCTTQARGYEVGATRSFVLSNQDDNRQFTVTAQLKYKTTYTYMWVEQAPDRINLNQNNLVRAADQFTDKILAMNRDFFGSETNPGVDCDPHLYILHASGVGSTVGGYFSSPDKFPRAVRPDSNEAEMFVVNAEPGYNGSDPGSAGYMSTLAHELQHMISSNQVHAPSLWLEEGAAQLAERLNGYGDEVGTVYAFASAPDTQLNTWSESSAGENSAHYGGGYLFWSYLYDRFGPDIVKSMVRSKERSVPALMQALAAAGVINTDTQQPFVFEELFADFVVANYMGRQKMEGDEGNRYNYTETSVPPMARFATLRNADYPYSAHDQVNQFGTHYIELNGSRPVTLSFTGSTVVPLLPTDDAQGAFWWSNRADASDPRLTREVDLTRVQSATLNFRAWYRIEKDYDYGYVSVSSDNGATWQILNTTTCSTENPNGSNLGCAYTGSSGSEATPRWVDESLDLSAYAGKKIQLRFEVVTDAGVNREGLALDNIEIPQIGFKDDGNGSGWKSEGWVRAENALPQTWKVQLIVTHQDGSVSLERMTLTDSAGSLGVNFGSGDGQKVRRAVLAISATTPIITEPGAYQLMIQ